MSLLQVENLTKSFGGLKVLTGVTFDVKEGEKLALIGPNGAGKSTLINTIGGQGPATTGKVTFDGHDITYAKPNARLHLGMARSFQGNNLFWKMSILDNVLLALHGGEKNHFRMGQVLETRKEFLDRAEELLKSVDLWEKRHLVPTLLSYGDQRLLEMMLAFTCDPKMVLLDEPSAGLPTVEAGRFAEKLRKISEGTTLLFCAHDLELVFTLADRIMVLYFGSILKIGTPEEINRDPQVREIYLGAEEDE
jgi:branched-chain amino acid transport system ATP-binding protein